LGNNFALFVPSNLQLLLLHAAVLVRGINSNSSLSRKTKSKKQKKQRKVSFTAKEIHTNANLKYQAF